MADYKTIKGKIVRILDKKTVIINLGSKDGVDKSTTFRILAEPEDIIDPDSGEKLGSVNVVKSKLKAQKVDEKFTIASTRWTDYGGLYLANIPGSETVDYGELNVPDDQIEPWKAKTEIPVKKGDEVEADIKVSESEGADNDSGKNNS